MMLTIKEGDLPLIESILVNGEGGPANLTSTNVRLKMVNSDTEAEILDVAAVIFDAAAGHVRYQVTSGQIVGTGLFKMEWEVTYPSGQVLTYPSNGFDYLKVVTGL